MNLRTLRHLASTCLAILVLTQPYPRPGAIVRASTIQGDPGWIRFAPPNEEITARIPGSPIVRIHPAADFRDAARENILAHTEYGGYGDELIFIIHSFTANRPQRLAGSYLNLIASDPVFERELSFDGITARQYRSNESRRNVTYTLRTVRFVTKKHMYLISVATLAETNPAVDRFLSSLRLRKPEDDVTPVGPPAEITVNEVANVQELTRRAIIVWKGEPFYTDEARAQQVTGTVVLTAVLAANGYVANISISKGLKAGLSERAIDAARNIRFFPGEKDGKPASQRIQLEYNFNLY